MLTKRFSTTNLSVALTTLSTTTAEIDVSQYAQGEIYIPTGSAITALTWLAAPTMGGTYLAARDAAGAVIAQTVAAANAYPIPSALFGAGALRATVNANGTVSVCLKS